MGTGTQRVTAKGAVLWQILVPVALAFVLFAGGLYVMGESTTVTAAADNAYDVLKDTLTIVLAVGALVIAVLGLGGYTFLRITLRRDVAEHVNQRFSTAMAWQSLNLGYTLWDQYSHTRELFLLRHA